MSEQVSVSFLKGKNVSLRPISKVDLPKIVQWINDPEVRFFLEAYLPQSEQDEEKWIEDLGKKKDHHIVLMIQLNTGEAIGIMGLHEIHWRDRRATTGALIGEKQYWGKGYGSEAKLLLLNYAFNTLNLRKIYSGVIEYNDRSYNYSLKCGYKEEGMFKHHIFRNGQYWNLVHLSVVKDDFQPIWEKYKEEK